MVAHLERMPAAQGVDLEWAEPEEAYARAFRDYGIDVENLPPTEAAARIAASPIKVDLAVTLDYMAWNLRDRGPGHPDHWQRLFDIALGRGPRRPPESVARHRQANG